MELLQILTYLHFALSIGLIISVVLQSRGSGMGTIFGGGGGGTFKARRGTEALLFNATILLGLVFAVNALAIAIIDVRTV